MPDKTYGLVHLSDGSARTIGQTSMGSSFDNKLTPVELPYKARSSSGTLDLGGDPVTTTGGITYEGDAYSLTDLLASHQVVSAVLLADEVAPAISPIQRRIWAMLAVFGLAWGLITGLAFTLDGFPIAPSAATFGFIATMGLVVTMHRLGRAEL